VLGAGGLPSSCGHGTGQQTGNQQRADVLLDCTRYFLHPNIHCRAIISESTTGSKNLRAWRCRLKRVSKSVSITLTYVEEVVPTVVSSLGVAAFLQNFEQERNLAMGTVLFKLLFSKLC